MFCYIVFSFLVVSTHGAPVVDNDKTSKYQNDIHCTSMNEQAKNDVIFNVSPINGNAGLVEIEFCYNGKINYRTLKMSEESCFFPSSNQLQPNPPPIHCFPEIEIFRNGRKSRTKMGVLFEYCGNSNENTCCQDNEFADKGYKCLVNAFDDSAFYQARYWKRVSTEKMVKINKIKKNDGVEDDTNNKRASSEDETVPSNSPENTIILFSSAHGELGFF